MKNDLDEFNKFYHICVGICQNHDIATDELTQLYRRLRAQYGNRFSADRCLTAVERQDWAQLLEQAASEYGRAIRDRRLRAAAKFAKRHSEFVQHRKDP